MTVYGHLNRFRGSMGGGNNEGGYDNSGTSGGDFYSDQRRGDRDEHSSYSSFRGRQMRQLDGDYDPIAPNTGRSSTKITLTTGFGSFL